MILDYKVLIVLDSNIIIRDFWMKGQSFEYLRTHMFIGHTLVIPEIVVEEVVNHFSKRADEVIEKVRIDETPKSLAKFHRIYGETSIPAHSDPKLLTKRYEKFLFDTVEECGGFIAETPEIPQDLLISRSIQRKKPFSGGDKGYRDTLIWYTILSLLDKNTLLSFVTNNTHDFFAEDGKIHSELLAEAVTKLDNKEQIKFHKSLDEIIALFDSNGESSSDAFRRALISDGYQGFDIWFWVEENLHDLLPEDGLGDVNWSGLPYHTENPILVELEEIVALDIPRTQKITQGIVRVSCDFAIIGHFQCDIFMASWHRIVSKNQLVDVYDDDENEDHWNSVVIRSVGTFHMIMDFDLYLRLPVKAEIQCLEHWNDYPEAKFSDEYSEE